MCSVKLIKRLGGILRVRWKNGVQYLDYLAEYNGVKCHAIFNPFAGRYFVDDVYGVIRSSPDRDSR